MVSLYELHRIVQLLPVIHEAVSPATPTPTTDSKRFKTEDSPEFRTDVGPVSAYMLAAKAGKKKRRLFLGIGVAALVIPIVIIVLFLVLPNQSGPSIVKPPAPPPDRSEEVIAMTDEIEGFLRIILEGEI